MAPGTTELRLLLFRGMDTTPSVPLLFPRSFSRALSVARSEFKNTAQKFSGCRNAENIFLTLRKDEIHGDEDEIVWHGRILQEIRVKNLGNDGQIWYIP